jgi:RNA polymerase sigma-70 factor (ECF subfamily)
MHVWAPRAEFATVSDEALMEQYASGDGRAFEELFRRYEPRAYAYFIKRARSPDRAQDLYQELFLRVHRARDAYDPERAFAPWFFRIAHRLLVDDERRAYRSREVSIGDREPVAVRSDPAANLGDREQLARALDTLSAEESYVLLSAKGQGIGYAEIAARLGKSVDAVKKIASRAMLRLRAGPVHVAGKRVHHSV